MTTTATIRSVRVGFAVTTAGTCTETRTIEFIAGALVVESTTEDLKVAA